METKDEENLVNEPFSANGTYSYADYLTWDIDYMVELIKGKVFKQAAAATRRIHQEIALKIAVNLADFLKGKNAKLISPLSMSGCLAIPRRTRTSSPWYSRIPVWSAIPPNWMKWAVSGLQI